LHWPEPFQALFPLIGCNLELLHHHQVVMRACIKKRQAGDKEGALREAELWVSHLTAEAQTTVEKGWFLPKVMTDINDALYALKARYDIDVNSLKEVPASHLRKMHQTPWQVRRVQDWLGYFWWEVYQDLACTTVGICEDCHNVIRGGHKDRKRCTQQENPECFRQHTNRRQRKHRTKEH
jgi:hypothetical protein